MSKSFDWMSNPQYLAQVGHFLAGVLVVFVAGVFFGEPSVYWTLSAGMIVAGGKEFVFDLAPWGEGDSLADSIMDFAFYVLGGWMGLGLWALANLDHVLSLRGG